MSEKQDSSCANEQEKEKNQIIPKPNILRKHIKKIDINILVLH